MKTVRRPSLARRPTAREVTALRARLAESEQALRAIRCGDVDSVVVTGPKGNRVFTLEGAEQAYRVLIESMPEGALTLTADMLILYANQSFARMVKCPLEQVVGSSFGRFFAIADGLAVAAMMQQAKESGSKIQVALLARNGASLAVQISAQKIAQEGVHRFTLGLVVTDLTESQRTEELLRALTQRVVQVQESERGRLALELHDRVTQPLVAVLFSSQTLATRLAAQDGPAQRAAFQLRDQLGTTAREVERISRDLRPGVLEQLGLDDCLRTTSREFTERTGVPVKLAGGPLPGRLPPDMELALYRILQEALKNIGQHARARHVTVRLSQPGSFVELIIRDDGIGFATQQHSARRQRRRVLGLLGMKERAAFVGGTLTVKSAPRAGTEVTACIPLPSRTARGSRTA